MSDPSGRKLEKLSELSPSSTGIGQCQTDCVSGITQHGHDGLGRRYRKVVTDSGAASVGGRNRTEYFYYDSQWRVLEVRNDQDLATRQFVWGTQYIDELLLMDVDTDGDGECTDFDFPGIYGYDRYRYFQDAHYNVVAIWDEHAGAALDRNEHFTGQMLERYEYDPYWAKCRRWLRAVLACRICRIHAALWTGSAASAIDLSPVGATQSAALAVGDGQQVGWSYSGTLG